MALHQYLIPHLPPLQQYLVTDKEQAKSEHGDLHHLECNHGSSLDHRVSRRHHPSI